MSDSPERIAVTGIGIVSALGPNAKVGFRRLIGGERGFRTDTFTSARKLPFSMSPSQVPR